MATANQEQAEQEQAKQEQANQEQAEQQQAEQQQAEQQQAEQQAEQVELETKYINQLTQMELIVLKIAKEHLQTSFDLKKSIGYKTWLKTVSGV